MLIKNLLFKRWHMRIIVLPILFVTVLLSCSLSDKWYFKEGGTLLWINGKHEDSVIKKAVQHTLESSSIIVAQVPWKPNDSSLLVNTAWYSSLAKSHGKSFMISIDWQKLDRTGTNGDWTFINEQTRSLFKRDMIRLLNDYNPDYMNLGVEVNYYALMSTEGFSAFASIFRDLKKELKLLKPDIKVGLSYQLELLYGHHSDWNESNTLETLDNLLGDIDYLGISTYPNMVSKNKQSDILFSLQYLDSIANKYKIPVGISETAVSSAIYNNRDRKQYIESIFQKSHDLDFKFIIWGSMIDAADQNTWTDNIGLLHKDGTPKKEFSLWKENSLKFFK
jgi:hypothetical protein